MAKAVFDNAASATPKNHFTVGIIDDVRGTSLPFDASFNIEGKGMYRGMFFGIGSDGTVGANKNTIKIIGGETENNAQGYFVYDSKKAGAMTVSHLRFGKELTNKPYLLSTANFVACHKTSFLNTCDMLKDAAEGRYFSSPLPKRKKKYGIPCRWRSSNISSKRRCASSSLTPSTLAQDLGLGGRINMIMQTAFFLISNIIGKDEAVKSIKEQIEKTYRRRANRS